MWVGHGLEKNPKKQHCHFKKEAMLDVNDGHLPWPLKCVLLRTVSFECETTSHYLTALQSLNTWFKIKKTENAVIAAWKNNIL